MTIYVDDMYLYRIGQFRRMKMSHMIADDEDELHDFARNLGLCRSWYQGDHYDVALGVRSRAVKLGAIEITYKQCGLMCAVRKRGGFLPHPDEVEKVFRDMIAERGATK